MPSSGEGVACQATCSPKKEITASEELVQTRRFETLAVVLYIQQEERVLLGCLAQRVQVASIANLQRARVWLAKRLALPNKEMAAKRAPSGADPTFRNLRAPNVFPFTRYYSNYFSVKLDLPHGRHLTAAACFENIRYPVIATKLACFWYAFRAL